VSTVVAAAALGKARYTIAKAVAEGRLPGYGIRSSQRTRWYVYQDVIDPSVAVDPSDLAAERDYFRARSSTYEEVVLRMLAASEKRRKADRRRKDAAMMLADAVRASLDADELHLVAEQEQDEALRQVLLPGLPPRDV
jgi:hypothetical protein